MVVTGGAEEVDDATTSDGVAGGILTSVVGRGTVGCHIDGHTGLARTTATSIANGTDGTVVARDGIGGIDTSTIGWVASIIGAEIVVVTYHQSGT